MSLESKKGRITCGLMKIVEKTMLKLEAIPDEVGSAISEKCQLVLSANALNILKLYAKENLARLSQCFHIIFIV